MTFARVLGNRQENRFAARSFPITNRCESRDLRRPTEPPLRSIQYTPVFLRVGQNTPVSQFYHVVFLPPTTNNVCTSEGLSGGSPRISINPEIKRDLLQIKLNNNIVFRIANRTMKKLLDRIISWKIPLVSNWHSLGDQRPKYMAYWNW